MSCLRCWPPMLPRRWPPSPRKSDDWVRPRRRTWCTDLRTCTCERDLRRCIFMYFSAFNPKKLGPTTMIARRLFSIPLQRSSDWSDLTLWILTSPIRRNWSTGQSAGQSIDHHLVRIIIHFLRCIASRGPASLVPGQHCWQCTFSRGNIVDQNIRKKYSQQYCRRRTFYQDCVFEEYLCIFSLYLMIYDAVYITRYPCIFSLHVECRRSWKSLIDGPYID